MRVQHRFSFSRIDFENYPHSANQFTKGSSEDTQHKNGVPKNRTGIREPDPFMHKPTIMPLATGRLPPLDLS